MSMGYCTTALLLFMIGGLQSPNEGGQRIVPYRDGYCGIEDPAFVMRKAGAEFQVGDTVTHAGRTFQIAIPLTKDALGLPPIRVVTLDHSKKAIGEAKELAAQEQKWNPGAKTYDITFSDAALKVVYHVYLPFFGGFVVKAVECDSATAAPRVAPKKSAMPAKAGQTGRAEAPK